MLIEEGRGISGKPGASAAKTSDASRLCCRSLTGQAACVTKVACSPSALGELLNGSRARSDAVQKLPLKGQAMAVLSKILVHEAATAT